MTEVTRTELNQQTARVLGRVAAGERLVITDRGRAVAEITPPAASQWTALVAAGLITPAAARGHLPFEPVESAESTALMLSDLRSDRA